MNRFDIGRSSVPSLVESHNFLSRFGSLLVVVVVVVFTSE